MTSALPRSPGPGALTTETANLTNGQTRMRVGTVTAVSGNVTTVTIAGGSVVAGRLSTYTPVVGNRVVLLLMQDSWVVLGAVVGPGS